MKSFMVSTGGKTAVVSGTKLASYFGDTQAQSRSQCRTPPSGASCCVNALDVSLLARRDVTVRGPRVARRSRAGARMVKQVPSDPGAVRRCACSGGCRHARARRREGATTGRAAAQFCGPQDPSVSVSVRRRSNTHCRGQSRWHSARLVGHRGVDRCPHQGSSWEGIPASRNGRPLLAFIALHMEVFS